MKTTLHIKTNKDLRDKLEKMAKAHGVTITALVNMSLRQTLDKGITLPPHRPVNIAAWEKFAGSMKGRIKEDPAKWQRNIRREWERKLP